MATFDATEIIVWERANKLGKWCPYSAQVCQFLEENHRRDASIRLGEVDESLGIYTINFRDMVQISEATGTKMPIRRRQCDKLGALGRGFSWQFLDDDNTWNSYDVDINNFIDCAFLEGKKSISLSRKFHGYHYEINFVKMIQVNKHTKRKRKIRRFEITSPYPLATPEDAMDVSEKYLDVIDRNILSPHFLNEEIPGTKDLENQVNAYKRNAEGFEYMSHSGEVDDADCSKHIKFSANEEQGGISKLEQSSSMFPTTVALVNGKAWSDSRPPHTPHSKLKPVPGIDPLPTYEKPRKKKRNGNVKIDLEDDVNVLEKFTEMVDFSPEMQNELCIICCESLSAPSSYDESCTLSKLTLCSHVFHKACLEAMYNSSNKEFLQCPSCKKIHGEKCGIQPPGEMIYHVLPYSLPGYPQNDTIRIIYDIHSGIQGENHPNPGKRYTARGFPRHCYLPDNEMGRKVLRLLIKAWKRRLIFTIGRSSTTGEENTVTWNEIHHKTEFGCNRRGHGYPDPNYFSNVLAELEAHGVIDDDVHVWNPV